MMTAVDDNSGIFVAFPNPEKEDYVNTANAGADLSVAGLEWRRIYPTVSAAAIDRLGSVTTSQRYRPRRESPARCCNRPAPRCEHVLALEEGVLRRGWFAA